MPKSFLALTVSLAVAFAGCVKKSGDVKETGRGTDSCNEWVDAYCKYVKRCSGSPGNELCQQAKSIECKTDAAAVDCATSLPDAACDAFPKGCGVPDLADPAPAGKLCRAWEDALCTANARCGADDGLCRSEFSADVDCDRVLGEKPEYETCVDTVKSLACGASLPNYCTTGLFVVNE